MALQTADAEEERPAEAALDRPTPRLRTLVNPDAGSRRACLHQRVVEKQRLAVEALEKQQLLREAAPYWKS